ncbi:MAG TPA: DUF4148 domain-containing protein [Paraburkholderia sp.]
MKRSLLAGLALLLLASTSAFAQGGGGIGRAGTYNQPWWSQGSTTTRAEVNAQTAVSHGYSVQSVSASGQSDRLAVQGDVGGATNAVSGQ